MPKTLDNINLDDGWHDSPSDGVSAIEAASLLAGEEFGLYPDAVDWPIQRAISRLNNWTTDELRQQLKPFIPRIVGTAGDGHTDARRLLAAQSLLTSLPKWMRAAGCEEIAVKLEECTAPSSIDELDALRPLLREARDAAWAARSAAWRGRREHIRALVVKELGSRGVIGPAAAAAAAAVAAAVAAADAATVAAAAAAAVAAAAAAAAAVAVAVADADAVAAAVADAVAAAVADADAVAAAVADADADADAVASGVDLSKVEMYNDEYYELCRFVYKQLREKHAEIVAEVLKKADLPETPEQAFKRGLDLLDAMCKLGEDERTPELHWEALEGAAA